LISSGLPGQNPNKAGHFLAGRTAGIHSSENAGISHPKLISAGMNM
jgi:hypothetical protein